VGILEHLFDPVKVLKKLKKLVSKKLIINIPNEPWFSFFLGMEFPETHVTALTTKFLEYHLGKADKKCLKFFRREFVGVWKYS